MALSVGIVGLPNVGKSTVFNALTAGKAEAANYPFCTIDPNVGVVPVPGRAPRADREAHQDAEGHPRDRRDRRHRRPRQGRVAGRRPRQQVPREHPRDQRDPDDGALLRRSERHPRARARSIRCATSTSSTSSSRSPTSRPPRSALKKAQGAAKTGNKEGKVELALAEKVLDHLQAGKAARSLDALRRRAKLVSTWGLLTAKPVLYCCNVGEGDLPNGNAWSDPVQGARAEGSRRRRRSCAARSRPSSPSSRPRIAASCSRRTASRSPRSRRSRASATACSACSRTSPPARRRSARGRSARARPRPRPPA